MSASLIITVFFSALLVWMLVSVFRPSIPSFRLRWNTMVLSWVLGITVAIALVVLGLKGLWTPFTIGIGAILLLVLFTWGPKWLQIICGVCFGITATIIGVIWFCTWLSRSDPVKLVPQTPFEAEWEYTIFKGSGTHVLFTTGNVYCNELPPGKFQFAYWGNAVLDHSLGKQYGTWKGDNGQSGFLQFAGYDQSPALLAHMLAAGADITGKIWDHDRPTSSPPNHFVLHNTKRFRK